MANFTEEQKGKQQEELENEFDYGVDSDVLPPANIMVAGITGTGKSTLINAVFGSEMAATGIGKPVTDQIEEYHNSDIPIHIWDTVGLELDSDTTKESINAIKKTIASKVSSVDKYDRVHAIWYCINSVSRRYQPVEVEFVKELYDVGIPFIIVLTQCSGDEDEINAFEKEIRDINESNGLQDIKIIQVLAAPLKLRGIDNVIPAFGLERLVDVTLEALPGFIKGAFIAAQKVDKKEKRRCSEEIIYSYVREVLNNFWIQANVLLKVIITDRKIMKMFNQIGDMYNTVLPMESIERIMKSNGVDFKNNFFGLISPIDMGYSKKITACLEKKKEEGFSVEVADVDKRFRAARMIAFYGYTFIDSIEELWEKFTEEQLKDVDMVVDNLVAIINRKLRERKEKYDEK